MCHGVSPPDQEQPLTVEHFDVLMGIAAEMGFESINYDDLESWRKGNASLPNRPIMIDFDHPWKSIRYEMKSVLDRYGFKGNLFVHTKPLVDPSPPPRQPCMSWGELGELCSAGWPIGAHTHSHPNLSKLSFEDPDGLKVREEIELNNALLKKHLGITVKDFAFTGTSYSTQAANEIRKRYRFGRLWIKGTQYQVDGNPIRYAKLVGVSGPDLPDGGPPEAARYITRNTHPHMLPSMEIQCLIYTPEAFRRYLEGALAEE